MILGFDTSGPHVSIALWDGAKIAATSHIEMAKGQAEALLPMVYDVLKDAGADMTDLKRIGVGVGPGNFTGVRISVAAARGLARGLGIEACGVSLLEAAAFGADGPVLACLAAPKEQAFVQGFGIEAFEAPRLVALTDLPLGKPWDCSGSGAAQVAERIGGQVLEGALSPAVAIAQIAEGRNGAELPKPLYLREPDAAPSRLKAPVLLT